MSNIMGRSLGDFEDPIHGALSRYADISDGTVVFDLDTAGKLALTADKPNAARSTSKIIYKGEQVGALALVIIAFAPGDCTGAVSPQHRMNNTDFGTYPRKEGLMPRSKTAMHTEGHLTLTAIVADEANADFKPFAGSLDLIGVKTDQDGRHRLGRIITLGHNAGINQAMMWGLTDGSPRGTATTGYYNPYQPAYLDGNVAAHQDMRFGDPHAVFNSTQDIQVAAFLGLTPEVAAQHFGVLAALGVAAPWRPKQH